MRKLRDGVRWFVRPVARHRARLSRRAAAFLAGTAAALLLGGGAVSAAIAGGNGGSSTIVVAQLAPPNPEVVSELPVPETTAAASTESPCDTAAVTAALASGDTDAVVTAMGGGASLREAVVSGRAPCIHLDDPAAVWFVVNKSRPFPQLDWAPGDLIVPSGISVNSGGTLRSVAAAAAGDLAAAARSAGVGDLAIASAYRSYQFQVSTYGGLVAADGEQAADLESARPGYSEHQSGLAADFVPCDASGCGSMDSMAMAAQGVWLAEHGWEYGWIVRYEPGQTGTTGYVAEPWHARYIGPELARAYHDGGFHTLEQFFGLPDAPDYAS